ncbi:oxidoreductase htatip2 [Plakobranchus ocellatus]|uniref:Oxidoreductase htatip2 n=1 Tax=Plakobranchus ocellatus TaxID=259542 RepID=A0AAV3YZL4_9GAST|nr:oxidoreductase htatip2 [Plakobranchus ocellatus]
MDCGKQKSVGWTVASGNQWNEQWQAKIRRMDCGKRKSGGWTVASGNQWDGQWQAEMRKIDCGKGLRDGMLGLRWRAWDLQTFLWNYRVFPMPSPCKPFQNVFRLSYALVFAIFKIEQFDTAVLCHTYAQQTITRCLLFTFQTVGLNSPRFVSKA